MDKDPTEGSLTTIDATSLDATSLDATSADVSSVDDSSRSRVTDPIALQILLEKEKQKCLKGIQSYYQKYGCAQIDVLRAYLVQLQDHVDDPEIQQQLDLLDDYS
jgi:hypothetical protein